MLNRFKHRVDPRRYNGAALLGLRGLVFKSHGSADAFAFEQALNRAHDAARNGLLDRVQHRIRATLAAMPGGGGIRRGDGVRRHHGLRRRSSPHDAPRLPRYSRISGTGSYLPPDRVSNADLAARLAKDGIETSDEWIVERTGIRFRHFAAPDVAVQRPRR